MRGRQLTDEEIKKHEAGEEDPADKKERTDWGVVTDRRMLDA